MDMTHLPGEGGKNLPIARIAGTYSIGEPMVGRDRWRSPGRSEEELAALDYLVTVLLPQLLHASSSAPRWGCWRSA